MADWRCIAICQHICYLYDMVVTIDTNVLFQALYHSGGASHAIIGLVRDGGLRLALSHQVLLEYEAVLTRPKNLKKFGRDRDDVLMVLRFLAMVSEKFEPRYLFRPNLKDEDDNMFVELAVVSQSRYLVTNNVRDFRRNDLIFMSFAAVTPSDFMVEWRKQNG